MAETRVFVYPNPSKTPSLPYLLTNKCTNISYYKYFRGMTSQVEALHAQKF